MNRPLLDLFDDQDLSGPVSEAVRRIALAGFAALWTGRTVTLDELVPRDPAVLQEAADHLRARGRIELSEDGQVIAVHGLARRPTRHRIEHDGGVVNTWCALDTIGIPAGMGMDARAVTECPICGRQLKVEIVGGEPQPLAGAVLWYPEIRCGHLIDDFCSGANLFCSTDHLERWLGDKPPTGRVMTLDEAAELGRQAWGEAAVELASDAAWAEGQAGRHA